VDAVEAVDEVDVQVVGLELAELLAEDALEVLGLPDVPHRQLAGEHHPVAHRVQDLADVQLALAAVVAVSRVEVVDALVQRELDHLVGAGFVDGYLGVEAGQAAGVAHHREAHGAESQDRGFFQIGFSQFPVTHGSILSI